MESKPFNAYITFYMDGKIHIRDPWGNDHGSFNSHVEAESFALNHWIMHGGNKETFAFN